MVKNFNRPRSIFSSLLLIFVSAVCGLILVAFLTFRIVGQEEPSRQVAVRTLGNMVNSIGVPPNIEVAQQLATYIQSTIVIVGPNFSWKSGGLQSLSETECRSFDSAKTEHRLLDDKDRLIYRNSSYCFYFPDILQPLSPLGKLYFILGIGGFLLVLFLAYWRIHWLFRPIKVLKEGVESVTAGDLAHRVQIDRGDELGDLGNRINSMTDRLQQMLEAKHHLLLAISHELRSPLTRTKILAEMITQPDLKEKLGSDLNRLNRLIGALLEAERINHNHDALQLAEVDLPPLLEAIIGDYPNLPIQLTLQGNAQLIELDELRFTLLMHNLLENAIRYRDDKPVEIRAYFDTDHVQISVVDQGPGISPEHLDRLGEAFYRPDTSRNRNTGGYGLGFYLGRVISQAHGGSIQIESTLGTGTSVQVALPYKLRNS